MYSHFIPLFHIEALQVEGEFIVIVQIKICAEYQGPFSISCSE